MERVGLVVSTTELTDTRCVRYRRTVDSLTIDVTDDRLSLDEESDEATEN